MATEEEGGTLEKATTVVLGGDSDWRQRWLDEDK